MSTPWRIFDVEVARLRRLTPTFLRVTFTGGDLGAFADNGFDQRVKLVLPVPGEDRVALPRGPGWYEHWLALPDERRNPVRTYTARSVRPAWREVDVDIALHPGGGGPVSRWAEAVREGNRAALVGPDAGYPGDHGGVEFRPPTGTGTLLLAGDETAVPATAAILERLPAGAHGEVLLEVPHADDALDLAAPAGMRVTWLRRGGAQHGSALIPAVRAVAAALLPATARASLGRGAGPSSRPGPGRPTSEVGGLPAPVAGQPGPIVGLSGPIVDEGDEVDVDREVLWEVPAAPSPAGDRRVYAWLAGEAGVIKALRRHLVGECGLDRRAVAFMGYWRLGRPEGGT